MGTATSEPTVHFTSSTAAQIRYAGEVDEVYASTAEGLRGRVVESIRLIAASAGEPVTAIVVEGSVRWPLIVHPDGSFIEATTLAETEDGEPAASPRAARAGDAPAAARPAVAPDAADDASRESTAAAAVTPAPAAPASAPSRPAAAPAAPRSAARAEAAAPASEAPALRGTAQRGEAPRRESAARTAPTVDDLLASRADRAKPRAMQGWQGAVRRATAGLISPRPGKTEQSRLDRERAVQRRLDGPRTIVILNPKGGAHKTTSTLLLAATFGTQRGGATLAWDNNETRGTLGWRAQNAPHHRTAVDLLEHLDSFAEPSQASLAALDTYVRTQVDARFDVLASDEDAAASSTIDAAAFDRLHGVLSRYYRLLIVDTGNNMRASNWVAAVAAADQLVIVSTVREDTAASAAWLLDGLREKGFDQKIDEAVTILAAPSAKPDRKLAERLEKHFAQVTADVVHVPFDAALVDGGPIDFDALSPETRDAWLSVAASIAARL
ncbi:MinD/ParA family ATP-binding protein [Microbacterium dextranolyticum]|uniref:MinD/ParA family ATP-binding protein n=3 Tax=Microbacterium dextranolyticum TaxID=36806 RepID=UPI00195D941F|nr:chromosome partitioning protein [Microbacterium dextranolyticum]MBM7464406.1 MinD-like ATPase involved in chromosome partitioning or flagellar assembly [Microbacterium dextranolyticum]